MTSLVPPAPSVPQPHAVTLVSLAEALQARGLLAHARMPDPLVRVGGVALRDAADSDPVPAASLVLAAGVRSDSEVRLLARQCAEVGSALAVKDSADLHLAGEPGGDAGTAALLVLHDNAAWLHTLQVVQEQLAPDVFPGASGRPSGPRDLFEIADLAAAAAGGPVTIEDEAGTLVAYSRSQEGGDQVRVATIVNRRSPDEFTRALAAHGVPRLLARADRPVPVSDVAPGAAPRVAVALREAGLHLGTMWALTASLDDGAREAFMSLARAAAAYLLQRHTEESRRHAVELEQLAVLLHGGAPTTAAVSLPAGMSTIAVLDLIPADTTQRAVLGARLDQRLLTLPRSPELTVLSGQLSGLRYLILTVTATRHNVAATVESWLLDLITDRATGRLLEIRAGIGRPVANSSDLPRSRREAEHALAVAKSRGHATTPVSFERCWAEAVLLRVLDAAARADIEALTPLRLLRQYDTEHGTEHIRTLRAWLRHQGNIRMAAEALHIHPNTLRYRMQRLQEAVPLDVDDPDVRFVVELQLRGTPEPVSGTDDLRHQHLPSYKST
ncbi:MAG TPA: helix-turn-helix domain-containing protein [Rugosimonospora sp.]|nr:helix-turn-helix domain-containing protein [Rugosimonospora sp.]